MTAMRMILKRPLRRKALGWSCILGTCNGYIMERPLLVGSFLDLLYVST